MVRGRKPKGYKRGGRYLTGTYAYALGKDKEQISLTVPAETFDMITALSYLKGMEGRYASVVRGILMRAVRAEVDSLEPADRKMFDERILPNVQTNRDIHRKQRRERADELNREFRLARHDDETRIAPDDEYEFNPDDEIAAP